jgi:rhodanese-related sulfurtransferase
MSRHGSPTSGKPQVTIDQLLAIARSGLLRLAPAEAHAALGRGAVLVDIRSDRQRDRDGVVPGAHYLPRNVLEWRCDPSSPSRDPDLARPGLHLMLMCDEGYQSSLAAATLQQLGLRRATDVIGGFQAWRAAGLPVKAPGGALHDREQTAGSRQPSPWRLA